MVEQVEAEVHEEDLHRDHDAVEQARQDAGFEVLLESLAVGGPPVTGLVAQSAQDGVVHACQADPARPRMPPTAALSTMTGRLFIRKPMYTRQMTGRKPRQVSRFARNIPAS